MATRRSRVASVFPLSFVIVSAFLTCPPRGYAATTPPATPVVVDDGRPREAESGLHFLRNRYYDARTATFLTPDPLGLAGGINLYGYVGNAPVTFVDPWGLLPRRILGAPNPLWNEAKNGAMEYLQQHFGDEFSQVELGQLAERFADAITFGEANRLRDQDTRNQTLQGIGERMKRDVERSGTPQDEELARRFEDALKNKSLEAEKKGKNDPKK